MSKSKTFFDMMDGVLEHYANKKNKQLIGVDMAHYYISLRRELAMNVQQWFFRYVDAIAGNVTEIKKGIELHANTKPDGVPPVPTDQTGIEL